MLHELCDFADLEYDSSIGDSINARSMDKASRLSPEDRALIDRLCGESYENILSLVR